jgi:phosphate transport system permease protein
MSAEPHPVMNTFQADRPQPPGVAEPSAPRTKRRTSLAARGEPYLWLTGAGLGAAVLMIVALLALVVWRGASTFWPTPIESMTLKTGEQLMGEIARRETVRLSEGQQPGALRTRILYRIGNYDLYGDDFRWVWEDEIAQRSQPRNAWRLERREWGIAIATAESLEVDGRALANDIDAVQRVLPDLVDRESERHQQIVRLEKHEIGSLNARIEKARLAVRRAEIDHGANSPEHRAAQARATGLEQETAGEFDSIGQQLVQLREEQARTRFVLRDVAGRLIPERPGSDAPLMLAQVVRAVPANDLSLLGKWRVYLSRWREFLTGEPREANTEGGVLPAIFGTFVMTVLMSILVAPLGVISALYLREYAKQGPLVSAVRIAVNNLAGVPSIVFGVFGLGFFCYVLGGQIDSLFYPERLPAPTFGTGGLLWASLTLALMTVPVVIVATEEALAAVPRSMREGSYACGASRWQTIQRIVLPRALPGIMTGLILAMARGAGEVAPLMITGVVKLAPELPIDGEFPFVHLQRSFMHLGFHIFDVGFQSRNSEAAKPMVFTTTLLLIALISILNIAAILIRNRLRRRFKTASF